MVGLLVGGQFVEGADLGVAFTFGNPGHSQVHPDLGALGHEVVPQSLQDLGIHTLSHADHVLVGEVAHRPGDPRPTFFREYLLKPAGPEAERGFAVRGFDGRALWREAGGDGFVQLADQLLGTQK